MNRQRSTPLWWLAIAGLLLLAANTSAQPIRLPQLSTDANQVPAEVAQAIFARLKEARPDLHVSNLRSSPMPNLYKIDLNGQLAFVSQDGNFLIAGEMYQVNPGHLVNLQEQERQEQERAFQPERAQRLASLKKEDMIIYKPEGQVKGHVYVFTDIDCPYCRKLHSQIPEMMAQGIEVRYLAFPRAGIRSRSAQKLETAWCSKNPQDTMTQYKTGQEVKLDVCGGNPVAEQYMLGQEIGVRGTPAIVLESGQIIPGAVSTEMLTKEMGI